MRHIFGQTIDMTQHHRDGAVDIHSHIRDSNILQGSLLDREIFILCN